MTIQEAKTLLSLHSCRNEDVENPKWIKGFLGSLRPFNGTLNEDNFHEIIICLKTLKNELSNSSINREIVSDIMGIIHYSRSWAMDENGMLKRNNLINENESKKLEAWINIISSTFTLILDCDDEEVIFEEYEFYKEEKKKA